MFGGIRWRRAKRRFLATQIQAGAGDITVWWVRHCEAAGNFPPNAPGYERLAGVWDDFAGWHVPGYDRLLPAAGAYWRQPVRHVLDLACGTGALSLRLAGWAESVVGLDASEAMLEQARARTAASHVRYVRADFRDFALGEEFDATVSARDSLNYVDAPEELTRVFGCVARHLRPGGLFVFDVIDGRAFQALAGIKTVALVGGQLFELYHFYDSRTRVGECRAVFRGLVERHRRVPLELEDVEGSAAAAGLAVLDRFRTDHSVMGRQVYVLRRV